LECVDQYCDDGRQDLHGLRAAVRRHVTLVQNDRGRDDDEQGFTIVEVMVATSSSSSCSEWCSARSKA